MTGPRTREEAERTTYGPHYQSVPWCPDRCARAIWPRGMWWDEQCSRKPGHGPDGLYCKQHAKMMEARDADTE